MYPKHHIIFGFIFSVILFLLFPQIEWVGFLLIFSSSILIDVDHYLYYVYKKKDLNLINAHKWFIEHEKKFFFLSRKERADFYSAFSFLHGIEILLFLLLLSIFSKYFFFIFIGFAFHLLLDIVDQTTCHDRIDKFSLISDFLKFKKLKFIGGDNE